MALGSWAIVKETPSLIGLIPMLVYIVLAMKKGIPTFLTVLIPVIIGFLLTGNGLVAFGNQVFAALGSFAGILFLLIMLSGGLGAIMRESGVSSTFCKWLIGKGNAPYKKAIFVDMLASFILSFAMGSNTASLLTLSVLLPVFIAAGLSPAVAASASILASAMGMQLSPFSTGAQAALELTGLTFGEYVLYSTGPGTLILVVATFFLCCFVQKKSQKFKMEAYDESDQGHLSTLDSRPTAKENWQTIGFFALFFALMVYMIATKQGMTFILVVLPLLSVGTAFFSGMKVTHTVNSFFKGCSEMLELAFTVLFTQIMLETVNALGGFDAFGNLLLKLCGDNVTGSEVIIAGTLVGTFGINGVTVIQMQVIDHLFAPVVAATGLDMRSWCMALVMGSTLTQYIYPNVGIILQMSVVKSRSMKQVMALLWVVTLITLAFVIICAYAIPAFL